nr:unnamed protein product [Digitaria exilis]
MTRTSDSDPGEVLDRLQHVRRRRTNSPQLTSAADGDHPRASLMSFSLASRSMHAVPEFDRLTLIEGGVIQKDQSQLQDAGIILSQIGFCSVVCDLFVMRVFNSFEDEFEVDIWSTLSKELGSTLSE